MIRILTAAGALLALGYMALPAQAESTVKCVSRNYQYDECWAGPLKRPQLIHQVSSSACILNRSWGYNPQSGYIWVANGCAGVFADVVGYHYGRGGQVDPGARTYDEHGHDVAATAITPASRSKSCSSISSTSSRSRSSATSCCTI